MTLMIKEERQLAGYYRLQVLRDGEIRQDTGRFHNLITDQGLNWIGNLNQILPTIGITLNTHVGVGTGTTTPAFTDIRLASPLAMYPPKVPPGNVIPNVISYVAGPPPYWSVIWTYQFALGAVVGNVSEVGVGQVTTTDNDVQVFSRNLILDSLGNPTVISVTALDVLVVTYELRYYIATIDNTYSMVIDGTLGPITYSGTYRRMNIGASQTLHNPVIDWANGFSAGSSQMFAYRGFALGPITGQPSYTAFSLILGSNGPASISSIPYVYGNLYAEFTTHFQLTNANWPDGITGFSASSHHGSYQFSVTPAIPKTASYVLDITWRVYWSRYP